MDWLQPNRKATRIRFRAMMESGTFVDEVADVVQTQVIAHKARASIRNRDAVPLYHHTEENRPPVWKENLLVETGLSPQPGMDSRYVLEDSLNLWKGIKTGAVEIDGESKIRTNSLAIVANVAAVIVFVACAWLAGLNVRPDAPRVEAAIQGEDGHGFVEELEDLGDGAEGEVELRGGEGEGGPGGLGGEAEGTAGPAGGGEGPGGSAEEPVGPAPDSSGEADNAPGVRGPP